MNKSESIKEIAMALSKFNGEVSRISKDANNPFFKNNYATLDNIIDEIRPILHKNGLSIMQIPSGDGQNIILKTLLLHESGEWLESDELIMKPVKNDPQGLGSTISYARRYSLAAFLSLNTGEDDDGNSGSNAKPPNQNQQNRSNQQQRPNNNQNNSSGGGNKASENQVKMMHSLVSQISKAKGVEKDSITDALKAQGFQFDSFNDLLSGKASQAIKVLQGWKDKATANN